MFLLDLFDSDTMPINRDNIEAETRKDYILSKVLDLVRYGWPKQLNGEILRPFFNIKNALSVEGNCLFYGQRIIIPSTCQETVLKMLHGTHTGMTKMKQLARSYFWWPKLDNKIEEVVKKCKECQNFSTMPVKAPTHPWHWPEKPWSRLHLDFAGPYEGNNFLLIIDAHSKWLDIEQMKSTTSAAIIVKLRKLFSIHGVPDLVITDNAPNFKSVELRKFFKANGIIHDTVAIYHPSSNGQIERSVQMLKQALRKMKGDIGTNLTRFLFKYRITPQATTGVSPAELLMGRKLKTHFDLLRENVKKKCA